jgi:membrane protease YdiL (CAAX protease family)
MFGLAHFILLTSDASLPFVLRIVILASIMGTISGYFQEKYDNNILLPLTVHMTINTITLIVSILIST